MKKTAILLIVLVLSFTNNLHSQYNKGVFGDSNWLRNWTEFRPKLTTYNSPSNILSGTITTNTTLYKKYTYQLVGQVYVTNNAVLTIEPGTVIRGDKQTTGTLIITKGSKIIAKGLPTDPIVFTTNNNDFERKHGDWGGIVLLGNAPINKNGGEAIIGSNFNLTLSTYGGLNAEDNSGIMSYVRIEFAGKNDSENKLFSSLTLAGVGNKTVINNIQVSFSDSVSYQGLGGALKLNNLISYRSVEDDFYFSQGVNCNISNSLAIRHPFSSSSNGSRCFEVESYDSPQNADFTKPFSKVVATNITMVNTENNDQDLIKEAVLIKENTFFTLDNSVVSGFKSFILLDDKIDIKPAHLAKIKLTKLLLNDCKKTFEGKLDMSIQFEKSLEEYYFTVENQIDQKKDSLENTFTQTKTNEEVDFRLKNKTVVAEN